MSGLREFRPTKTSASRLDPESYEQLCRHILKRTDGDAGLRREVEPEVHIDNTEATPEMTPSKPSYALCRMSCQCTSRAGCSRELVHGCLAGGNRFPVFAMTSACALLAIDHEQEKC